MHNLNGMEKCRFRDGRAETQNQNNKERGTVKGGANQSLATEMED